MQEKFVIPLSGNLELVYMICPSISLGTSAMCSLNRKSVCLVHNDENKCNFIVFFL